jgi:phage tail-like protein
LFGCNPHILGGFIMADKIEDVLVGAFFRVDVAGKALGIFSAAEGGSEKKETVEHRYVNAKGQPLVRYEAGISKYTPLKLSRGYTGNKAFNEWFQLVSDGKITEARIHMTLVYCAQDGSEVARKDYFNCFPVEITLTKVDAKDGNQAIMEVMTFVYEEIKTSTTGQTAMA